MRRLLLLLTLVFAVAVAVYRDRLYLRDPLGKLERDGVRQEGASVFINFENDVLVQEKGGTEMFAVQHWNRLESVPANLMCVQGLLCVAPADRLTDAAGTAISREPAEMSDRRVSFVDENGRSVQVTIR